MRGKVGISFHRFFKAGITPAYAGKSGKHYEESMGNRDHPRLCGEKKTGNRFLVRTRGSPPPMRGKVHQGCESGSHPWITPAYAGKRKQATGSLCVHGDHPRLCGEKSTKGVNQAHTLGSPPPMRGKGECKTFAASEGRITPAYAGKSFSEL